MKQKTIDSAGELQPERDEDLISTLMEISVIAKRLANHKTTKTSKTMEDKKMQKHYELIGEVVHMKFKHEDSATYPWQGKTVPVLITGEYENFLIGEVLPHLAPLGFGLSHPYPICIDKHDIATGEMIINGGAIR